MAFTGKLGTPQSQPGEIVLGSPGGDGIPVFDGLSLSQTATPTRDLGISVSDPISFGQAVNDAFGESLSNTMSLGDLAEFAHDYGRSVSDPMSLSHSATATTNAVYTETPSHTLGISDSVAANEVRPEPESDDLGISDSVTVAKDIGRSVSDPMSLTQTPRSSIFNIAVDNTLGITDEAIGVGPIYITITQNVGLGQSEDGHQGTVGLRVDDYITFHEVYGSHKNYSVSQTLGITDNGHVFLGGQQVLGLTQGLVFSRGVTSPRDVVSFTDSVAISGSFGLLMGHALGFNDSLTYYLEGACTLKNYTPFIGSAPNPLWPPPPGQLVGPLPDHPRFLLVYPATGTATDLLNFRRAPDFTNKDQLAFNRVNRVSRGGTPNVFADPKWPKAQTMVIQFSALRKNEADALRVFMSSHLGEIIGIVDWEGRYWTGIIKTPNNPIVQDDRNGFSTSFEFQGKYDTWTEQDIPSVLPCDNG